MSVVIAIEEAGPCRMQLTIEVPAPAVEAELGRVVNEFRKEMNLPGFRRGKVPTQLIRQRFREDIEKEVADRLVPRYWNQAQAEKALDPLLPPRVEELKISAGEPMTFVATVETRPRIEVGSLTDFDLPQDDPQPTKVEIEEAIDELRRRHSMWVPVERSAARGDLAVGSLLLDAGDDAEDDADDATAASPFEVELGDERVWEELSLALTGLAAGQKATFDRRTGEGEEAETTCYRLEVTAVKERELPDIDEDLISKFGEFDNAEEWRQEVAERLGEQKTRELRNRRESALSEQLCQRHPLELPVGVVDQEVENQMRDYAENLSRQGVDLENVQLDWERMSEEFRPASERRVHVRLVLDAVAEDQAVSIDEAEFEKLLGGLAASQGQSSFALRQQLSENGRMESLRAQVRRDQTVRQLLGEVPAEEPATADTTDSASPEKEA